MRPAHDGGVVRGPHVYVKRADGSSGYEPAPEVVTQSLPSSADLDANADEQKAKDATEAKEAPKKAAWGNAKSK